MPKVDYSRLRVLSGRPWPIGPTVYSDGISFTIFSRHAEKVWLAFFEEEHEKEPAWETELDPMHHRIGDMWSVFVQGAKPGLRYMWRMGGPWKPEHGHRYEPQHYLLDPYARAFVGSIDEGTMKCVALSDRMDWADDVMPRTPMNDTIIYEAHVRGLTKHESSGVSEPGTYRGLIEKIPYLKDLGITAVELLPIHEFGERKLGRCSLVTGEELTNYWGYSNIGFFAPAGRYASSTLDARHVEEFRAMVHALHDAGIEVILDVVFNHTSEGNERGPTLCFRGIDNAIYYLLDKKGQYLNYSGCGNTVNCNHPLVRDFIIDCLRYWVSVMHIDGFRFDLASILGRDQDGRVLKEPPLIKRISEDPLLRDIKLIAEAWDAGGAYQVGSFGGVRWAEWNGRYRDDVRRYWRGDSGTRGHFATRIMGSADLYEWAGRSPEHSINFITCHDGFTLRDLVSYRDKRNWANGEGNRDGSNDNLSFNCGVEGDIEAAPEVYAIRRRMQKNFIATLFLSLGVPMFLGGDEFGRTQKGNNNAYCQDNEISWFDWNLLDQNKDLHRFTRECMQFRKQNPTLSRRQYYEGGGNNNGLKRAGIVWFDENGVDIDWLDEGATVLGCHIHPEDPRDPDLCLLFNNTEGAVTFPLPEKKWHRRIDTSRLPPQDILGEDKAPALQNQNLRVSGRTVVVLSTPRP